MPALTPQETTRVDEKWLREHDAYYDCLDGGYRGYQGACWDCDWRGPERLRGDEEIGTEESRQHKRNAKLDAKHHRETAPWTAKDDTETLLARAKAAEQALERLREGPDHQYEHHVEQCAHGGTLMRLDQAEQALERADELAGGDPALLGEDCEYGCEDRCEDLQHWKDRTDYLHEVSKNQMARAEAAEQALERADELASVLEPELFAAYASDDDALTVALNAYLASRKPTPSKEARG